MEKKKRDFIFILCFFFFKKNYILINYNLMG